MCPAFPRRDLEFLQVSLFHKLDPVWKNQTLLDTIIYSGFFFVVFFFIFSFFFPPFQTGIAQGSYDPVFADAVCAQGKQKWSDVLRGKLVISKTE